MKVQMNQKSVFTLKFKNLIQQTYRNMDRLCGNIPCFLSNQTKYEVQIPLIYQNPDHFYFPHELDNPRKSRNTREIKKYDLANENKAKKMDQNLNRVKSQASSNLWASHNMSLSNNASTVSDKQDCNAKVVKQNINPKINTILQSPKQIKIYFDNQLYRSKSSEKVLAATVKKNEFNSNSQIYPEKNTYQKNGGFDIVPVSQYHELIQNNHKMKRIIQQEYRPLKNCYESLRQQQKNRQKLIMLLQHKVKQLGQKLKQRSIHSMNYMSY